VTQNRDIKLAGFGWLVDWLIDWGLKPISIPGDDGVLTRFWLQCGCRCTQ